MGSVTPSTALAAMAASIALPPDCRISMAASVASGWLVAAMPFLPTAGERVVNDFSEGRSTAMVRESGAMETNVTIRAGKMLFKMTHS